MMSTRDPASMYRKQAIWSAIAGALFLIVAIFNKQEDWRRVMSLVAGICMVALSFRNFKKAKANQD
jgi:cell division protein FtsW (lipid II flippase)